MKKLALTVLPLVCIFLILPDLADAEGRGSSRLYRDRLEIGRALLEVQSTNWPSVLQHYTDDIEYHDPIVDIGGIESMSAFLAQLFANSPDLMTTIEQETLLDGIYSATWTMVGQFSGVPYEAKGISILEFRGRSRQVAYQRDYYTEGDIMTGIPDLDTAIEGFRTFYRCAVDPTFDCPFPSAPPETSAWGGPPVTAPPSDRIGGRGRSWIHLRRDRLEIARAVVEINASNWTAVLPYYADDVAYRDPIVEIDGIDTMTSFLGRLFASGPDLVTTVETESLVDGVYTATWTMTGSFGGVPFSAPGMSIVVFGEGERKVHYARDYYTEGDIMINVPELTEAVVGFRTFYRCAVDPTFECPFPPLDRVAALGTDETPSPADRETFVLGQNTPNPFNPATTISYRVPAGGGHVALRVYDVSGRHVTTLVDGFESAGRRTITWHGEDDTGQPVASGIYFYRLDAPEFSQVKKMILIE